MSEPIDAVVDLILKRCPAHVRLAAPLGLGKPNRLINAIYQRIAADSSRRLTIYTALSLDPPQAHSDLERRFLGPFLDRQFGRDYPRLDYVIDLKAGRLPANIRVQEFYFQSGAMLGVAAAQRDYASINYTEVARELAEDGIDVLVHLVARRSSVTGVSYSLSCNPDVTLDLLDLIAALGQTRPLVIGVVQPDLPFLGHDAEVMENFFDRIIDDTAPLQPLFALPRDQVDLVEHAIGLHASALVRDGGTLQIGIGALSDALVWALLMRQQRNEDYCDALRVLRDDPLQAALSARIGGETGFKRGLYGASEMVMDGFMHLRRAGILDRHVYDDLALQRALDSDVIGETLRTGDAARLRACGVLPARLDANEVTRLQRFGFLPDQAKWIDGRLRVGSDMEIAADIDNPSALATLDRIFCGRRLCGGRYLRGAFYLGSHAFYDWLRGLDGDDYAGLAMTRVSDVNQLYGGRETLDATQRGDARFFNTCMIATLLGAAVSDALEDGRVVSGVGGQYNFVAMAHAIPEGRSVLLLRSTRESGGKRHCNIRWNYGHTTIPRHLRDIYVTEYGVADLRGRSDETCIRAMLSISDAQFVDELAASAIHANKLPRDFKVPDTWRRNTPEHLRKRLATIDQHGLLPAFPFGSDFSAVERRLLPALGWLKHASTSGMRGWLQLAGAFINAGKSKYPDELVRMGLANERGLKPAITRRLLRGALRLTGD